MGNSARSLLSGSATTFVGTALSAAFSTAYVSLGARWLGPAGYGEVAATVSMANLFFMALHPLETGLTLRVAAFSGRAELAQLSTFLKRTLRGLLLASAIALCLWGGVWAVLAMRAGTHDAASMQWLGLFCGAALVQCLPRSGYRGRERFGVLAVNLTLESALRLLVGLGLLSLGAGPSGMLAGYALGTIAAVAHGAVTMFAGLPPDSRGPAERALSWADVLLPFRSLSAPLLGLNVYTAVMVNVDVLAATHFLPAHDAGLYAGASSVARLVSIGASPLLMVLFSRLAVLSAARHDTTRTFQLGVLVVIGALGFSLLVATFAGELILHAFLGEAFKQAHAVLLYQWATACVVVTHVFLADSLLATSRVRAGWLFLVPAIVLVIWLLVLHDSALIIARTSLLVCGVLGSAVYALLWRWRVPLE